MDKSLRLAGVCASLLILAGCAVPATYGPRGDTGGTGYADTQLAANRWRVTFTGNSATKRDAVENYLLRRSAEVTLAAGYRWFVFDNRDTEAQTTYHSTAWPGLRRGWYRGWYDDDVTARPVTSYEAFAEIVLLKDDQAKNEPRALEATDVIDHLRSVKQP
jgi:hypothetical protein